MADLTTKLADLTNRLAAAPGVGVPLVLFTSTASASNVGVAETNLMTYSLPANALNTNGQAVRITAWGTSANNANSKTVRVYFGATAVCVGDAFVTAQATWMAEAIVVRTGAATQIGVGYQNRGGTGFSQFGTSTPAETLSAALTIKVTGQSNVGGGDVTALGMLVEWLPVGATA